jgi:hypothetical protein
MCETKNSGRKGTSVLPVILLVCSTVSYSDKLTIQRRPHALMMAACIVSSVKSWRYCKVNLAC